MVNLLKNTREPVVGIPLAWIRKVYGFEGAVTMSTLSFLREQDRAYPFQFEVERLLQILSEDWEDLVQKAREGRVLLTRRLYAACTTKYEGLKDEEQKKLVLIIRDLFKSHAFIECMNDKFSLPPLTHASSDNINEGGRSVTNVGPLPLTIDVAYCAYYQTAPGKAQEWVHTTAHTIIAGVIKIFDGASDTPSLYLSERNTSSSINSEEDTQHLPVHPLEIGPFTSRKGKGTQNEGQNAQEDVFGPVKLLKGRSDNDRDRTAGGTDSDAFGVSEGRTDGGLNEDQPGEATDVLVRPLKRRADDALNLRQPPAKRPSGSSAQMPAQPMVAVGSSTSRQDYTAGGSSGINATSWLPIQQGDTAVVPVPTIRPRRSLIPVPVSTTSFAASNLNISDPQAIISDVAVPRDEASGNGGGLVGRMGRGRGKATRGLGLGRGRGNK